MIDDEYFSSDEDVETTKEEKKISKKRGRKCSWPEEAVTYLVDILLENEIFKTKFLLTNTKNAKNRLHYQEVIDEMRKRSADRDKEFFLMSVKLDQNSNAVQASAEKLH